MIDQTQIQITGDEFEVFLSEHRDSLYELIHGEIVEKVVTEEHGSIAANIVIEIGNYLKKNRIGRVAVEARYKPEGDNVNARLPDVSFRRTTDKPVKRGPVVGMPDLAVEIKSPDDTNQQMRETAAYYLENGCKMVWLVYPGNAWWRSTSPMLISRFCSKKIPLTVGMSCPISRWRSLLYLSDV